MAESVSRDLILTHKRGQGEKQILIQLATSSVCTSSPEEELRVFERCYKEHTTKSITCRGDTWGPKYNPKYEVIVTRLNTGGYIIRDIMTLQKSVTR